MKLFLTIALTVITGLLCAQDRGPVKFSYSLNGEKGKPIKARETVEIQTASVIKIKATGKKNKTLYYDGCKVRLYKWNSGKESTGPEVTINSANGTVTINAADLFKKCDCRSFEVELSPLKKEVNSDQTVELDPSKRTFTFKLPQ